MDRPVLISGATGFVGTAVSQRASAHPTLRIARHGRGHGAQPVYAVDVTDRAALAEIARGAGSVIHCVSYVGRDADLAWHVNDEGTRVLVEVAADFGIRNIVYISTTAVYGAGAHERTSEKAPLAPSSDVSRSRLAAERRVLAAGGSVIRPHLTYGVGDRWFIPQLLTAASLLRGVPRGVRLSAISVDQLANQAWSVHDQADRHRDGGIHNASHDLPTTLGNIVRTCRTDLALRTEDTELDPQQARVALLDAGLSPHQADMVTKDSLFTSNLSQRVAGLPPPQQFRLSPHAVAWYRGL